MILPILSYGHPMLRQQCASITEIRPDLELLIKHMWKTMHHAHGCGLAAPQVNKSIRLFIVDSQSTFEEISEADRKDYFSADDHGIRETFINPKIVDRSTETWEDTEGCLSIPGISVPIKRSWSVTIEYLNAVYEKQSRTFSGLTARMIQHEYDHIEGILHIDHITPLRRKLLSPKLKSISKNIK